MSLLGRMVVVRAACRAYSSGTSTGTHLPITRLTDAKKKSLDDVYGLTRDKTPIVMEGENKEVMDIAGVPEEHVHERRARIYRNSRSATQSGWKTTDKWKIELDNRSRWENPLMGWCSTGDPLSNTPMKLDFASKEDAITFCEKNRWEYDLDEPQERKIEAKSYGVNFHWNKRTRVGTK